MLYVPASLRRWKRGFHRGRKFMVCSRRQPGERFNPSLYELLFLGSSDRHRVKHCQFCHTALSTINRPIHLDRQYLSMQGLKEGDYFYTKCRWGANRFVKRWTKISNRYNACHRCRLTEETAYKYYESITLQEQQRLESAIYK